MQPIGVRTLSRWLAGALIAAALAAPSLAAQESGTIRGRITDREGGAPVEAAQVFVVGRGVGALANNQGSTRSGTCWRGR